MAVSEIGTSSVLLIERDETTAEILSRIIMLGYPDIDVEIVADLKTARQLMVEAGRKFDIVVYNTYVASRERALHRQLGKEPDLGLSGKTASSEHRAHDIEYRPLELRDFIEKFKNAVDAVERQKALFQHDSSAPRSREVAQHPRP